MFSLTREQTATLKNWFLPERPGPLVGAHVINTGNGACFVDRWPDPRVVLAETAGNYALVGATHVLAPTDLQPHTKGFVATSESFVPALKAAFPEVGTWQRVVFTQQDAPSPVAASDHSIRRLEPSDTMHLQGLDPESAWISKTWGGPDGLAASGFGWGVFVDGQLASVACTFFLGNQYEELGVVTESRFRGLGLSTACARMLCSDIQARGHQPIWTTSLDNMASIRVAEKLGFVIHHHEQLYVVGIPIPTPVHRPANES